MTPLQSAKQHCDNYQANGTCLGIAFRDDLSMYRFRNEGLPCLLCEGRRCSYFEEIIIPMRMSCDTAEAKARADKKDAAVRSYLTSHNLVSSKATGKRMCLNCRRIQVQGRARFCHKCAERRKRQSYRLSKRQSRLDVQKLAISLVRAEALTNAGRTRRCRYTLKTQSQRI